MTPISFMKLLSPFICHIDQLADDSGVELSPIIKESIMTLFDNSQIDIKYSFYSKEDLTRFITMPTFFKVNPFFAIKKIVEFYLNDSITGQKSGNRKYIRHA